MGDVGGPGDRLRVVILLGYDQDPVRWRSRFDAGRTLDVTPYGYELAEQWCEVTWARSHPESAFTRRVRLRAMRLLGFDLVHAWRNRRLLRAADVVWAHTEREHLAVAALPLPRPQRVVAQSVWLWDEWSSYSRRRQRRTARLLHRLRVEYTLSPANAQASTQRVTGRRVQFLPFGTQVAGTAAPADVVAERPPLVLAPGNDVHRDWPLLMEVARALPDVHFRVATNRASALALDWPANASVGPADADELRELYAGCAAVAVPLRPNLHASGVTVCLEAIGAGRPLVVTDVGGVGVYVDGAAELAAMGDVAAFTVAIRNAITGSVPTPGSDFLERRGLTQRDYVLRFVRASIALATGQPDATISAFASVPAPEQG